MPYRAPSDPFARFVHAAVVAMALSLLLAVGGGVADLAQPAVQAEPATFASTPMPQGVVESEILSIEVVHEPATARSPRTLSDGPSSGFRLPQVSLPTMTF